MRGTCFELREPDVRAGQRGTGPCPEFGLGCRERVLAPLKVSTDDFKTLGVRVEIPIQQRKEPGTGDSAKVPP